MSHLRCPQRPLDTTGSKLKEPPERRRRHLPPFGCCRTYPWPVRRGWENKRGPEALLQHRSRYSRPRRLSFSETVALSKRPHQDEEAVGGAAPVGLISQHFVRAHLGYVTGEVSFNAGRRLQYVSASTPLIIMSKKRRLQRRLKHSLNNCRYSRVQQQPVY